MLFGNTLIGKKADGMIRDLRTDVEQRLTASLRAQLAEAGWPARLVQSLSVKHGDTGFDVKIPEGVKSAVLDIEYGTESAPPLGTLRKFRRRLDRGAV